MHIIPPETFVNFDSACLVSWCTGTCGFLGLTLLLIALI